MTGQSTSFRLIVFVDRPPCHLLEIESLPPHGHAMLVLTGVFRILTRNFRRLVPREFCGGDHIVLLVGVSGELSTRIPIATLGYAARPINARRGASHSARCGASERMHGEHPPAGTRLGSRLRSKTAPASTPLARSADPPGLRPPSRSAPLDRIMAAVHRYRPELRPSTTIASIRTSKCAARAGLSPLTRRSFRSTVSTTWAAIRSISSGMHQGYTVTAFWIGLRAACADSWSFGPMTDDDHLSNDVGIEGQMTQTGLSARAKSRAVAAIDRLLGAMSDVPAARMEAWAKRIRNQTRLDSAAYDAAITRVGEVIGSPADAAPLVDEVVASRVRAMTNKRYVIERAIEHFGSPSTSAEVADETDSEEIDPDWLNHFDGHAEKATAEKVRDLWGRVLAGEIRQPGSFSLMTLRLLAELDQQMASWFEQEVSYRAGGAFIVTPADLQGEQLTRLYFLEEAGLIQHVTHIGGMNRTFSPNENGVAAFFEGDLCLRMTIREAVQIECIPITRMGQEICRILPPVDAMAVLKRLGEALHSQVISMDISRIINKNHEGVRVSTVPIEVLKVAPNESK